MFKYGRIQRKNSSQLVCGSRGTCLDCMLLRVQVTAGLGFFLHHWLRSFSLCIGNIVTPGSIGCGLPAGPWWDSGTENKPSKPREVTDIQVWWNATKNSILVSVSLVPRPLLPIFICGSGNGLGTRLG